MGTDPRGELLRIFPQWLSAAAEHRDFVLGDVMKFSSRQWFFPDFHFIYDDKDFIVPLYVDCASLIEDLLAHKPGSFHFPGVELSFPKDWNELNQQQIHDCLWHALDDWFYYVDYRVGSAMDWQKYNRGQVPGDLRVGCLFEVFSEKPNLQFLTALIPD
ncbi:hypothetical protein [Corynebacterium crudilactis]|uniref:Uncharacterized protein n=1 Tax=Corynebacterium crudilactis TaxID=1652495 RepID=A0A172QRA5_9CORY|nr:hypothetical protein [Corynebacterium crudilactis]ANE03225.1 hypothetical protein ccrud_02700 [Corynebacterium crudilactis]